MALLLSLKGLIHSTYHCYVTDSCIQHTFEIGLSKINTGPFITTEREIGAIINKVCQSLLYAILLNGVSVS